MASKIIPSKSSPQIACEVPEVCKPVISSTDPRGNSYNRSGDLKVQPGKCHDRLAKSNEHAVEVPTPPNPLDDLAPPIKEEEISNEDALNLLHSSIDIKDETSVPSYENADTVFNDFAPPVFAYGTEEGEVKIKSEDPVLALHSSIDIKDETPILSPKSDSVLPGHCNISIHSSHENIDSDSKYFVRPVFEFEKVSGSKMIDPSGCITRTSHNAGIKRPFNAFVKVVDLFPSKVRIIGKAHTNSGACECKYCWKEGTNEVSTKTPIISPEEKLVSNPPQPLLSLQNNYGRKTFSGKLKNETNLSCDGVKGLNYYSDSSSSENTLFSISRNQKSPEPAPCEGKRSERIISSIRLGCPTKNASAKKNIVTKMPIIAVHRADKSFIRADFNAPLKSKRNLVKHTVVHSSEKRSNCEVCSSSFKRKRDLKYHMPLHSGDSPFSCKDCNAAFKRKMELKSHMLVHSSKKLFNCNDCSAFFKKKMELKSHMLVHTSKKPFSCKYCSASFKTKIYLERHMLVHTSNKPFICKECSASFKRKAELKQHMIVHSSKKPFNCKDCTASFKRKTDLKPHMLVHSREKPFNCEVCSSSFKKKIYLKRHMLVHSGDIPFSCEVCSSSFKTKNYLKRHMLVHSGDSPFSCEDCNAAFKTKMELKSHMHVHSDDSPFSCKDCNAAFKRKVELKSHMLVHSADRPFSCNDCSASFKRKMDLKKHILCVHRVVKTRSTVKIVMPLLKERPI